MVGWLSAGCGDGEATAEDDLGGASDTDTPADAGGSTTDATDESVEGSTTAEDDDDDDESTGGGSTGADGGSTDDGGTTGDADSDDESSGDGSTDGLDDCAPPQDWPDEEEPGDDLDGNELGLCGDGDIDAGELCDDGNVADGDTCSSDCSASTCLVPVSHPTIQHAMGDYGCDTVWVAPGTYLENLDIRRPVVIQGVGQGEVIIDGGGLDRTISIGEVDVELRNLHITGGHVEGSGGGIQHLAGEVGPGPGATLLLSHCLVEGNSITPAGNQRQGAGIHQYGSGTLILRHTAVTNNLIDVDNPGEGWPIGVGVAVEFGDLLHITDGSAVVGNRVTANRCVVIEGIGVHTYATDTLIDGGSRVADNFFHGTTQGNCAYLPVYGAGIFVTHDHPLVVENATIENNRFTAEPDVALEALGAGIYARAGAEVHLMPGARIQGNVIEAPAAQSDGWGAGLFATNATSSDDDVAVEIHGAVFRDNRVEAGDEALGGAIGSFWDDTEMVIEDSLFENNTATGGTTAGGAIAIDNDSGYLDVRRSTFVGNTAVGGHGGAIFLAGAYYDHTLHVANSTIVENAAYSGGGVHVRVSSFGGGTVDAELSSVTLSHNQATIGGAMSLDGDEGSLVVRVRNTIAAANEAGMGPTCSVSEGLELSSEGYNLWGDLATCPVDNTTLDLVDVMPGLGLVADHGGPTPTIDLLPGSPAIDAGDPAGCTDHEGALLLTDQRGYDRACAAPCDIGAFEYAP